MLATSRRSKRRSGLDQYDTNVSKFDQSISLDGSKAKRRSGVKLNPSHLANLPGGLDDQYNQQWSSTRRRQKNKYAYLEDLTFIDWKVLKPPPPPKVKKVKKSKKPKNETPEEREARERKAEQKRAEEEKRRAEEAALAEKKAELQSKFNQLSGGSPTMNITQAAAAAREFGYAPSAQDLLKFEAANGAIDLDCLMKLMAEAGSYQDDPDDLVEFFKQYDRGNTGKLKKEQIMNIMRTYGEPLTNEEMKCLLELCGMANETHIDYRAFVALLVEA